MLTRELAIAKIEAGLVIPECLTRSTHAQYLVLAEKMCRVYSHGVGRTRGQLHASVRSILEQEAECPRRRMEAFCKLLDERCGYESDKAGQASKLRRHVVRLASKYQPLFSGNQQLFGHEHGKAKQEIAAELGLSWNEIERRMFLDLMENHAMLAFEDFDSPGALLSRYNVAQMQVAFFDASDLTLRLTQDFRSVLRYAKLARLMHRISRTRDGYMVRFDGPASLLQHTTRYGTAMAKFLPGLLSCDGWKLEARIRKPKFRGLRLLLDSDCGLQSPVPMADTFDSSIEEKFSQQWTVSDTHGWRMERETEILHQGQTVFFPDFVFIHEDGRKAMMEVIGFWTPEYLEHKRHVIETFTNKRLFLAVQQSIAEPWTASASKPEPVPLRTIVYKTVIPVASVLEVLNSSRLGQ
jgi:uncharacterized protein